MRKLALLAGAFVFALSLQSAVEARPSANLDESIQGLADAIGAADAAATATHYADDAILMPPGSPRVVGQQAIGDFWKGAFDAGVSDVVLMPTEVDASGKLASETGDFTLVSPSESGPVTVKGKYIVVWRRDADGIWRVLRDIWNTTP